MKSMSPRTADSMPLSGSASQEMSLTTSIISPATDLLSPDSSEIIIVQNMPQTDVSEDVSIEDERQVRLTFNFQAINILAPSASQQERTMTEMEFRNLGKEWIAYKMLCTSTADLTLKPTFCGLVEPNGSERLALIALPGLQCSEAQKIVLETFFVNATGEDQAQKANESLDVISAWEDVVANELTVTKFNVSISNKREEVGKEKIVVFLDRFPNELHKRFLNKLKSLHECMFGDSSMCLKIWLLFLIIFILSFFLGHLFSGFGKWSQSKPKTRKC